MWSREHTNYIKKDRKIEIATKNTLNIKFKYKDTLIPLIQLIINYAQLDSNQWGKSAADLQSDAFDHSAMCAIL